MKKMKTVIVTGAGSGMGRATALKFANDGFQVVLNGRTKSKLEEVANEICSDRCLVVAGDVSKESDVKALVKHTIDTYGQLDVLVNNAAIFVGGHVEEVSLEDWNKQLGINVTGPFLMIKHSIPYLKKSQGCIVNVSSVSGMGGDWGAFAYNSTKGAINLMTKGLALDLAEFKVRVNAVAPSLTDTNMAEGVMEDEDTLKDFKKRIAMGRPGHPEEVADVIAFLASDEARFVTGTILPVDGGLSASNGQPKLG